MKEIKEIIKAFENAQKLGEQTALATVVKVDGSSYRRPGARMLVTENGALTGAISGGCLEGDALKKAQLVIFQKKSMVVTYDTTDDDDAKFGVGLGCNGIIHILIEPIDPDAENHPVALLKQAMETREPKVLVTLFDLKNKRENQIGTCMLFSMGKFSSIPAIVQPWLAEIEKDISDVIKVNQSVISQYAGVHPVNAFIELVLAPISLVVVGAGNDAMPLCKLADVLGWEVTLIDGRSNHATTGRFPTVHRIHVADAEKALTHFKKDERTAVVLMTHNFNYDLAIMEGLLPLDIPYLGVLGPKKKLEKMLENLENKGVVVGSEDLKKIFGPVGLHIGAEAPEEIALSIISEVKTVLGGGDAGYLRDKQGPIHLEERGRMRNGDN
jgi:xanthine dehydrogenase accessory factor